MPRPAGDWLFTEPDVATDELVAVTTPIVERQILQFLTAEGAPLVPVVAIDTSGRPDLSDLQRVVLLEGRRDNPERRATGAGHHRWFFSGPGDISPDVWFVNRLEFPVRLIVVLRFELEADRPLLTAIEASGKLMIAFEPLVFSAQGGLVTQCMGSDIDPVTSGLSAWLARHPAPQA